VIVINDVIVIIND